MANYVYIATSLDGYIATKDDGIDWLMDIPNPDNSDFGFQEFINRVDALIMGKNTFKKVLTFSEWPYDKMVFVLSNRLKKIPEKLKDKVEFIKGDLHQILAKLRASGFDNFYIDGGKAIQSFLKEDLIDEMIITRIPIVLGEGIPLFGYLAQPLKFSEVKTEILNEQLVKSYYKRTR